MSGISITPSSPSVGTGFCLSSGISLNPTLSPFISYSHLWSHIMIIFLLWSRNVSEGSWEMLIIVCVKLLFGSRPSSYHWLSRPSHTVEVSRLREKPKLTLRLLSGQECSLKIGMGEMKMIWGPDQVRHKTSLIALPELPKGLWHTCTHY